MNERELYRDLSRMIRGELLSSELRTMAQSAGYHSFAELCESQLPETIERVSITLKDVVTRIDGFRSGAIDLDEVWSWADELYNISYNHKIAYEPEQEEPVLTALSVLSVVCNRRLFPLEGRTAHTLERVRSSLARRGEVLLRQVFLRAFEDLPEAHLAIKSPDADAMRDGEEEDDEEESPPSFLDPGPFEPLASVGGDDDEDEDNTSERWADVVLLDGPFDEDGELSSGYNWVIAFAVLTRDLYDEELKGEDEEAPPDSRARRRVAPPSRDRVPTLRRLVPNFDFDRMRPLFSFDSDGIGEIVLDVPTIGLPEVRYATKLFALHNRIPRVTLNGERVKTLAVRSPKRARRSRRKRRADRDRT